MLTKDTKKRISIKEVMTDKWFKDNLNDDLIYCELPYMIQCL
jgi:hypothetical protein